MKNVFLIGDSIREGYGRFVREELKDFANVYEAKGNCQFTYYTLCHLHEMLGDCPDPSAVDLVHWNNGLWDTRRMFGDEPLTPIDVYADTLDRIYRRIRILFPNAFVLFSLTTTVDDGRTPPPNFARKNEDVAAYNAAASEVMKKNGVPVLDLYTQGLAVNHLHKDWTHFNDEGSAALARFIAKHIRAALAQAD